MINLSAFFVLGQYAYSISWDRASRMQALARLFVLIVGAV